MPDVGILGLAQSGKTTVFNAVTRGNAQTGYGGAHGPNIGVVKVPDRRLDVLAEMFHPKKVTPADIRYADFPAAGAAFGRGEGPGGQFLAEVRKNDALIHVVRLFENAEVPHPEGGIDAMRDIGTLDLELAFADQALIQRRLERLGAELRSLKPGERTAGEREQALLTRLQQGLERDEPIRAQPLSEDEERLIAGYRFLTQLPMLVLLNIGEDGVARAAEIEAEYRAKLQTPKTDVTAFCGKLEMELAEMEPEEAAEYRAELGLGEEAGLDRAIRLSYHLMGLISFLTAGEDECRAWTVRAGSTAPQAAGKIHSDLERGFIRAEVVRYDDLVAAGTMAEAKKRGLVRMEGKTYVVKDGDVLNILFNV
ncbi:MAG TPA: redox-regulated ATPase YchF [Dehalococcoidia bacterium]|nr:redox-regulated ATPase YchF [Dehalococcoidia bacterium]